MLPVQCRGMGMGFSFDRVSATVFLVWLLMMGLIVTAMVA